jgi:hypothetical protein
MIMHVTFLIVEKLGNIKEISVKNVDETELYKKAGFKTIDGFKYITGWNLDDINGKNYSISLYGKTTGRANQENKYEFPPPVDTTLFFGNCVLINKQHDEIVNLTKNEWDTIYETLFGGFEDLDDEDDDEEEDEEDDLPRTKSGYVKDDFVVDDDEEEEEEEDEDEEEEDEEDDDEDEMPKSKSRKMSKSKSKPKAKLSKATKKTETIFTQVENYLNCTRELSEEEYIE